MASATSSSCATSTVTDVWVSCTKGSASTTCTPVSYFVTAGCSVTASSTTVSCTPTASASVTGGSAKFRRQFQSCSPVISNYIVWPADRSNTDQTTFIQNSLDKLSNTQVEATTNPVYGVLYWTVPLSSADAPQLSSIPGVCIICALPIQLCSSLSQVFQSWSYNKTDTSQRCYLITNNVLVIARHYSEA